MKTLLVTKGHNVFPDLQNPPKGPYFPQKELPGSGERVWKEVKVNQPIWTIIKHYCWNNCPALLDAGYSQISDEVCWFAWL